MTVNAIPTTTTLSLASASIAIGANAALTATVTSGSGVPSGTVTFFSGTTSLGTGNLTNGTATVTTTSNTVGSETITAVYSAAGNFGGSTSAPLTLSFTNPLTLSLSATAISIALWSFGDSHCFCCPRDRICRGRHICLFESGRICYLFAEPAVTDG